VSDDAWYVLWSYILSIAKLKIRSFFLSDSFCHAALSVDWLVESRSINNKDTTLGLYSPMHIRQASTSDDVGVWDIGG
jgi:hypothetical protein